MRARQLRKAEKAGEGKHFSHFGPENNLFPDLDRSCSARTAETGQRPSAASYLHDAGRRPSALRPASRAPSRDWEDLGGDTKSDVLFYEGLHGGYVEAPMPTWTSRACPRPADRRGAGDQPGVDPEAATATSMCAATRPGGGDRHHPAPHARLRALHLPAVQPHTHVNFQRVPMVDTSNPFISRRHPVSAGESMVVIRFANPKGIDFPYLMSDGRRFAFMSPRQHHRRAGRQDGACRCN